MQSFGVVARKQQLHCREKSGNIFLILIADILANAFVNGYLAAFELDDSHGDAVDINDQIGAAVAFTLYGYLLGDLKIVLHRVFPVDEVYHFFVF